MKGTNVVLIPVSFRAGLSNDSMHTMLFASYIH